MPRRQWTAQQKAEIVLASLVPGVNIAELCRQHQVCASQVYSWREKFLQGARSALANGDPSGRAQDLEAECQRLHELIGKLTVENEALKRGRHWLKK
jgi:transposase-like protein